MVSISRKWFANNIKICEREFQVVTVFPALTLHSQVWAYCIRFPGHIMVCVIVAVRSAVRIEEALRQTRDRTSLS